MKAAIRRNAPEQEAAIQRGISADPDNPEWTGDDFKAASPVGAMLPQDVYAELAGRRRRGPGVKPAKAQVTLRLDRDVIEGLRASGSGWQLRANHALRLLVRKARGPSGTQ